jgi:hypothetical protein
VSRMLSKRAMIVSPRRLVRLHGQRCTHSAVVTV